VNRDILRLEENPLPPRFEKMETKEKLYRVHLGRGRTTALSITSATKFSSSWWSRWDIRKDVYRRLK
jgi:hypothetical protein